MDSDIDGWAWEPLYTPDWSTGHIECNNYKVKCTVVNTILLLLNILCVQQLNGLLNRTELNGIQDLLYCWQVHWAGNKITFTHLIQEDPVSHSLLGDQLDGN